MKNIKFAAAITLVFIVVSCGKQTANETVTGESKSKPIVKPGSDPATQKQAAIKNSFWEVNKHLDQGGSFFVYLSTEQMLTTLDGYLDTIGSFADMAGREFGPDNQQQIAMVLDMARTAYEQSGIRDVSGLGASSFALEKNLNRDVIVLHHYAEKRDGLMWKLLGNAAHDQDVLKLFPADTVLAMHGDADVVAGFNWLQDFLKNTAPPPVVAQFAEALAEANQMFNFENLLKSTDGELGLFVTLDAKKRIAVPLPDAPPAVKLSFPAPAAAVVLRVKDDQLLNLVTAQLKNPEVAEMVQESTVDGVKLYTIAVPPIPVEIDLSPTIMKSGNYLILTSSTQLAKDILAMKGDPAKGLAGTAEFKKLAGDMDLKGNQFHFLSSRVYGEYGALMKTVIKAAEAEAPNRGPEHQEMLKLMKKIYPPKDDEVLASQLGILRVTPEGIVFESRNTGDGMGAAAALGIVGAVGVGASMLLPALAKAKQKANQIKSANNARQLGIGLMEFATDNDGKLPDADKWCDAIAQAVVIPALFASPLDPFTLDLINDGEKASSYAFNAALGNKNLDEVNGQTVMIFEAGLGWNGSGGLKEAQQHMRQNFVNEIVVTYVDGSSEILPVEKLPVLRWNP